MRKTLVLCFLLLAALLPAQEYFSIANYNIDVNLSKEGYFDVVETIDVDFTEERHGIFRTLPFRYEVNPLFNLAENGSYVGGQRYIYYEGLRVDNFAHLVEEEGHYKKIRIGSADTWVNGRQQYIIRYRVWGAFNRFASHDEFAWNFVGDEWPVDIAKINFSLSIDGAPNLTKDDMIIFTGVKGSKNQDATYTYNKGKVVGQSTKAFASREGLTFSVKLPKNYLATVDVPLEKLALYYYVDRHKANIKVNTDASIEVEERFSLVTVGSLTNFTRIFSDNLNLGNGEYNHFITEAYVELLKDKAPFKAYVAGKGEGKNLRMNSEVYLDGKFDIILRYKVWGAISQTDTGHLLQFDVLRTDLSEPARSTEVTLTLANGLKALGMSNVAADDRTAFTSFSPDLRTAVLKDSFQLSTGFGREVFLSFAGQVDYSNMPPEVFIRKYLVSKATSKFKVNTDGSIDAAYQWQTESYSNYTDSPFAQFNPKFYRHFDRYGDNIAKQPLNQISDYNIMAYFKQFIVANETFGENDYGYLYPDGDAETLAFSPGTNDLITNLNFNCTYKGILNSHGKNWDLLFPISLPLNDPSLLQEFEIAFPAKFDCPTCVALICAGKQVLDTLPLRWEGNSLVGATIKPLLNGQSVVIKASIPKSIVAGPSFSDSFQLVKLRYKWLLVPLWAGIPLLVLWLLFGRDKTDTLVVQYEAPEDITPAEAGLLWDDKLHNKDLLALIYYWAGLGYIKIKEEPKTKSRSDYELIKVKDLYSDAKPFEKTMFNALFSGGKSSVKVKDLRNSYYTSIQTAAQELEQYGKQHNFYIPGTRGFGRILRIIGLGIWILGGAYFVLNLLNNGRLEGLDFLFGFGVGGALFYFFGKVMPRKGHLGTQQYNKLLGFREFIKTAEGDRLKQLLDENPRYYEETISFAIVFGLGDAWARKFEGLLTAPPSFYEGYHSNHFSNTAFMQHAIGSLNRMGTDMNYIYVPPSSSSSSGGSSWSGGGGSSFGGGGSSGGGFGGGGGGSW
jgi:uncharacterized membrane protein YgcG